MSMMTNVCVTGTSLCVCVVWAFAVQHSVVPKEVEVESLVIRNDAGTVVVRIGCKPESKAPGVYLYNNQEQVVAELAVHEGGSPELRIGDGQKWKLEAILSSLHNNDAKVIFWSHSEDGEYLPVAQIGAGGAAPWQGSVGKRRAKSGGVLVIRDSAGNTIK